MATVTGMTAAAMAAIRDGVIVDADIVGENLILTKFDGSTINAGVVRGPEGPMGPAGLDLSSTPTLSILEPGHVGQIRAGHQLSLADFSTLCKLPSVPVLLANLGDLTNPGTGPDLSNKGAVPFGAGISGAAAEAAVFSGSTGQALYVPDTGGGDPFRLRTGTFGAWVKTARRGTVQAILSKGWGSGAASSSYYLFVVASGAVQIALSMTGTGNVVGTDFFAVESTTDIADDRWHHVAWSADASMLRLFIDGVMESQIRIAGPIFGGTSAPFNLGGINADGSVAAGSPFFGRVDEVFLTPDILTEDQIRLLYAAKIPHGMTSIPKQVILSVRRRRRGPKLVAGDFPAQPARLYNLDDLQDLGSNNVPLVANPGTGSIVAVPGPDGSKDTGRAYAGAHAGDSATDAGLPSGLSARTYGVWFKTTMLDASSDVLIGWGTSGTADARLWLDPTSGFGVLRSASGADQMSTHQNIRYDDGNWHHAVVVEDNAAGDGVKRKLYVDSRLVATSVVLNSITLVGANRFRIGANPDGTAPLVGQLSRAFVYAGALTAEQVRSLFYKGAQDLGASPKNAGDHVETFDATDVYAIFDSIESQNQIDMAVAV